MDVVDVEDVEDGEDAAVATTTTVYMEEEEEDKHHLRSVIWERKWSSRQEHQGAEDEECSKLQKPSDVSPMLVTTLTTR